MAGRTAPPGGWGAATYGGNSPIRHVLTAALVAAFVVSGVAYARPGCQSRACEARVAAKHARWSAHWCNRHRACRNRVRFRRMGVKGIALRMLIARGDSGQFGCLVALWGRESGWSTTAHNPSGAHGIPQALPGSKMGPGWESNAYVQIRWGLQYVYGRYGGPCSANAFQASHNWY